MSEVSIRPYQADGLEFLVAHRRAALFDEQGLGKCMQALLAMDDLVPEGRILIVATGDAIGVWQDEIDLWLGQPHDTYAGTKATKDALYGDRFIITNYHRLSETLSLCAGSYDLRLSGVIFDEVQMLRNRNTKTLFHAVRHYFDKRQYGLHDVPAFFLSGTPIVKGASDLWPILHLIDKRRWSSYWAFVNKYAVVTKDHFGWHVEGLTNAANLWREVDEVGLRRLQVEVQPHLPPLIRQRVPLTMTPRQAKAYRELERDMIAEIDSDGGRSSLLLTPSVLARETRLRQLLVSPRLLGIDDPGAGVSALVEVASRSADPFVIYTPFTQAFPYIEGPLAGKTGRPTYTIQGGMGQAFSESVKAFKLAAKAGEAPILIASVHMAKSWSVAEVAHECYMLGFDWNAITMTQAESRLKRDPQKHTVLAHYLAHEDTHDMDQLSIVSGKRRIADIVLDRVRIRRQRCRRT